MGFATTLFTSAEPDSATGAVVAPSPTHVCQTNSQDKGYDYARTNHPIAKHSTHRSKLEAASPPTFSLRMAGIDAVFRLLRRETTSLSPKRLRRRISPLNALLVALRPGVQFRRHLHPELVSALSAQHQDALRGNSHEPHHACHRHRAIAAIANSQVTMVVDNLPQPYLQRPIELGAHIVVIP